MSFALGSNPFRIASSGSDNHHRPQGTARSSNAPSMHRTHTGIPSFSTCSACLSVKQSPRRVVATSSPPLAYRVRPIVFSLEGESSAGVGDEGRDDGSSEYGVEGLRPVLQQRDER